VQNNICIKKYTQTRICASVPVPYIKDSYTTCNRRVCDWTQTLAAYWSWSWDFIVSALNSLTTPTCQGRHYRILTAGNQDMYLSLPVGHLRTHIHTHEVQNFLKLITVIDHCSISSWGGWTNSKWVHVNNCDSHNATPTAEVWSWELKPANHRKVILTWI
jgi:hypothetical protein